MLIQRNNGTTEQLHNCITKQCNKVAENFLSGSTCSRSISSPIPNDQNRRSFDHIRLQHPAFAHGVRGDAYKGYLSFSGTQGAKEISGMSYYAQYSVIRKVLRGNKEEYKKQFKKEYEILKSINHQNIVGVLNNSFETRVRSIYMEDAGTTIGTFKVSANANENLCVLYQIAVAVSYLHNEKNICHNDLNDENVVINKAGRVKLIDFGMARKKLRGIDINQDLNFLCHYLKDITLNGKMLTKKNRQHLFNLHEKMQSASSTASDLVDGLTKFKSIFPKWDIGESQDL